MQCAISRMEIKKDPNRKDNWDRCCKCLQWWHETCAALSGTYTKKSFICDSCTAKRSKK